MILQDPRQGETAESLQKKVDELFSQAPMSTGLRKLADRHGSLVDPSQSRQRRETETGPGGGLLSSLSILLLIALVIAGIVLYIRVRKGYWLGTDHGQRNDLPQEPEKIVGSTVLRERARQQARSGEYREAIRLLLMALLTLISERKLLAMARNLTTREIYARLPKNQESEEEYLGHFFQVFEEASYGGRSFGPVEFEDLDSILNRGIQHELLKGGRTS